MYGNGVCESSVPPAKISFQRMLHDLYKKGCGMCYPLCGIVHLVGWSILRDRPDVKLHKDGTLYNEAKPHTPNMI